MSTIRTYEFELPDEDRFAFCSANIIGDGKNFEILYTDRLCISEQPQKVSLSCDNDEECVQDFTIKDKSMFITVKCKKETTATYSKHMFRDLIGLRGSINPTHC